MRLNYKTRLSNALGHRHYDENGYLYVDESPILRAGILEYLGQELIDGGSPDIDGEPVKPDKVYRVYISPEELNKSAETFKMLPLVNDHTWLGVEGEDAKDYQEGTTGENTQVKGNMLYVPLKFTGDEILSELKNGKEELSASYTNKLSKANSNDYDLLATDIKGNHIALVEKGRCGSDVRVLNQKMEIRQMKSKNEMKLVIDGKEIDLAKFFEQEEGEEAHEGTGAITEAKNDEVDKRALIDEIGGILKDKVDEEILRTVLAKVEEVAYNGSEASEADNEEPEELEEEPVEEKAEEEVKVEDEAPEEEAEDEVKAEDACKASNYDRMYAKISNALAKRESAKNAGLRKAYNVASAVMGEFNPFGMSEKEMLVKALNHQGIATDKESIAEMYAMLKVCNATAKVDNSFDYGVSGRDEIEINM